MGKLIRRLLLAALVVVVVLNWTWGRLPVQPPPPAGAKFAQVGGVRLHYQEHPGREPAVVMVHGLPGVWGNWDPVVPELAGRRTIVIDRPGYGLSGGGYQAFDDQVRTLHAFTRELGLRRPVIAGFSYGGTIALGYALAYPRETRSIVLVDAAAARSDQSVFAGAQAAFARVLEAPVIRPVANAVFAQLVKTASAKAGVRAAFDPDPADPVFTRQVLDYNMQSDDLRAFADETLNISAVLAQIEAALPRIHTPAYVLQGRQDKDVDPNTARVLARRLPNVQATVWVPGGHVQPFTHPAAVARLIERAATG